MDGGKTPFPRSPLATAALAVAAVCFLGWASPARAAEVHAINTTVAAHWNGQAPCLSNGAPTDAQIAERLRRLGKQAPKRDVRIGDRVLRAQPKPLADALTELMRDRRQRDLPAGCADVVCASKALFGNQAGPRLLLIAASYRYDAVPLVLGADAAWSAADLDLVLAAFDDFALAGDTARPQEYRLLAYNEQSPEGRLVAAQRMGVAATAGEGEAGITFYQAFQRAPHNERRAIVVHELAHEFVRVHGRDAAWKAAWRQAAARDAALADEARNYSFASAYGMTNLDEDIAESVVAYRYAAPMLKRRAPNRYAFIRDQIFGGVEYGSAQKCRQAHAF